MIASGPVFFHRLPFFERALPLLLAFGLALNPPVSGIVLLDSSDPLANTGTPTGILADSGWQYLGLFGGFLGTAVGPSHFITAVHIGVVDSSFTQSAAFTGGAEVVHTIDSAANGGLGYWDIPGTDLRIYQVLGVGFSNWAPLYTGTSELGSQLITFGRGGVRGDAVTEGGDLKGWKHTGEDGITRWGLNTVSGLPSQGGADLLSAAFDDLPGLHEATLSVGDSGGPVFIQDEGVWKLAGINYAVDGAFDTNNTTGDGSEFGAALFDRGGLWQGSDATSWQYRPDLPADDPSSFYASRISSSAAEIQGIVMAPEPGTLTLGCAGLVWAWRLRFRRRQVQQKPSARHWWAAHRK